MTIATIIAARDAERTIARAVRSALAEPEVSEVIVVDDASRDKTRTAALSADDRSGRLALISLDRNGGPAAARNIALARSRAPFLAVLDADDLFLPGRFAAMGFVEGTAPDCDAIADNILFASESTLPAARRLRPGGAGEGVLLGLETLISGNISKPRRPRGELGFLKPVFRRTFLEQHALAYNPALRLGEDYEFYVRLIALGGRFRVMWSCGYLAVERADSLSARHSAADLAALATADQHLLDSLPLGPDERAALLRHQAHVRAKHDQGRFLDMKRHAGLASALAAFRGEPARLARVLRAVAADKVKAWFPARSAPPGPRTLLQAGQL